MKKFNKTNYLIKLKIRRWLQNYSRYLYIGISCLFICVIGVYFAYSKFFVSKEEVVIKTTVGNFTQGDVIIGAYIDNEYSNTIPGKNDGYTVEKVVCDNEAIGKWDIDNWGLLTTNLTKKTKCSIYFVKFISKVTDIIANLDVTGKCPTLNDNGSVSVTDIEETDGYLCKAKDDYGDSYYYRGVVTNNYVKFAGFYWRIVRINGDGTIRVVYDGTSAHANGESSTDRQIGKSAFNSQNDDNAYIGYMYGTIGASTYNATHTNTNNSTIKTFVDNWYKTNILGTVNEQYLADNIFCNDRSISTYSASANTKLGYGKNITYYRWFYGPWNGTDHGNSNILLKCPQQNDAFTVRDTVKGNGALTYPIGLLSTDEIVLAGGWNNNNSNYYLYSGQYWWAATPHSFRDSIANERNIAATGNVYYYNYNAASSRGVRPVLNLKAEVLANGDGTMNNPYRLEE